MAFGCMCMLSDEPPMFPIAVVLAASQCSTPGGKVPRQTVSKSMSGMLLGCCPGAPAEAPHHPLWQLCPRRWSQCLGDANGAVVNSRDLQPACKRC